MSVIEAPIDYDLFRRKGDKTLFLAGGITNCREWQTEMIKLLPTELVMFNPRRNKFPDKPNAAYEQISWEFKHLRLADAILFWFSDETPQPIALLEFGKWIASNKQLFVGVDHHYERKLDVKIQLSLERPNDCHVFESLEELSVPIFNWFNYKPEEDNYTVDLGTIPANN